MPNGMRLIVAERHAVRLVSAELVMVGGSASLPGEAPAAWSLIAGSAVHGTKSFTETQLFGEMNAHLIEINPTYATPGSASRCARRRRRWSEG